MTSVLLYKYNGPTFADILNYSTNHPLIRRGMGQITSSTPAQPLAARTTAPIEKLNPDTILAILQVVDEFDLLRLRLTSKWLNHFTRDHSVWALAFKRVMYRFQVPTNAIRANPVPATMLEKLACRPTQFERYILRSPESPPPIRFARRLQIPLQETSYNRSFHLLPGGRWLLTGDNSGILRVFDLCVPAQPEQIPLPCAASFRLGSEITGVQMQAQASREAVTLLVSSEDNPSGTGSAKCVRWQIIHVKFVDNGIPSFHKHSEGIEVKHVTHGALCGDFVALPRPDGSILIWNWAVDEWFTIVDKERYSNPNFSRDQRIFIDAPYCVCMDMLGGSYSVLRMPMDQFVPRTSGVEPPVSPAQVVRDQDFGGPGPGIFSNILQPTSLSTPSHRPSPVKGHFLLSRRQIVFCASQQAGNTDDNAPAFEYSCHAKWDRGWLSGTNRVVAQTTINGYPFVMVYRPVVSTPLEIHAVVPKPSTAHTPGTTPADADRWMIKSTLLPLPWDVDPPVACRVLVCPMSAQIVMVHPEGWIYIFEMTP